MDTNKNKIKKFFKGQQRFKGDERILGDSAFIRCSGALR